MSVARSYALEAKFEFVKLLRIPGYLYPTLLYPLMFYVFFGLLLRGQQPGSAFLPTYLLATYGAFGVIGATLFGFGLSIAVERGQGWMLVKRASPMPPMAYFSAKVATSVAFSAVVVGALFLLGATAGGVHLPAQTWFALAGSLVLGALPFCAMGLAVGSLAGPNSAPAVINLINVPLAFLSGLWIPLDGLPAIVKHIAPFLPAYHLGQLALGTIGAGDGGAWWVHAAALLGFTAIALAAAAFAFRRDEGRLYG